MGLEFKPYFAWEEEEAHDRHVNKQEQCAGDAEKQQATTTSSPMGDSPQSESDVSDHVGAVYGGGDEDERMRELAPSLSAVNSQNREYAVLVASEEEEEDVNEYKSYFSLVLDYPQFFGQSESKESALRQAGRRLHHEFGSMILKNEAIPAPSIGAQLEAKKAAMERDWQLVKLGNFSMELVPLQFQCGVDYTARPPDSDGEYESDHEDEELFELDSRMSTP